MLSHAAPGKLRGIVSLVMSVFLAACLFGALFLVLPYGGLRADGTRIETVLELPREPLFVVSASGRHRFEVEIAETPQARARGLMYREALASDAGMLFDFQEEREVAFWMKNTLIPLDMIFIEASGRIAHIARETEPLSEELVPSRAVVRFVLEVPGGTAARLGIVPGDVVQSDVISAAGNPG
ncbi:DUF192 domain-containing protein [Stappia stellulata]|uniref:DUF192 domain-containing protein n=1 Tax=Stappia stellulata TaxID=71235 RepID=UPI001AD8AD60|nr:DUF192 domain-containing protein [Stappia stellulata]